MVATAARAPIDLDAHRGSRFSMHIRDGLIDPKHYKAMGDAIWLYLYLHKECAAKTGTVKSYHHQNAAAALSLSVPTIKRYMERLKDGGYVQTTRGYNHLSVQITRYDWQEGRRGYGTTPKSDVSGETLHSPSEVSNMTSNPQSEVSEVIPTSEGEKYQLCDREVSQSVLTSIFTTSFNGVNDSTANAVGADAPPPTQKRPRTTKAPKPKRDDPAAADTADLPYRLSEAILLAADRPATRRSVLKIIGAVKTEVIDAYCGQGVMFTDAKACLAYMQTHPDYAGLKAKWITWDALAKELGPWLKAGKPAQYVESVRSKTQAAPPKIDMEAVMNSPQNIRARRERAEIEARLAADAEEERTDPEGYRARKAAQNARIAEIQAHYRRLREADEAAGKVVFPL
jgi:hypothetical protein